VNLFGIVRVIAVAAVDLEPCPVKRDARSMYSPSTANPIVHDKGEIP
jgi:hypothetical protein